MLFRKKPTEETIDRSKRILPVHVGIIMDGNGRWAKKRGLPRQAGHKVGAATFKKITRYANSIGIKNLTVYAFSTENWKRPKEEIDALMDLFYDYLIEALRDFSEENIRTIFIGDVTAFSPKPSCTKPLSRSLPKIIFSPCTKWMVRSARVARSVM